MFSRSLITLDCFQRRSTLSPYPEIFNSSVISLDMFLNRRQELAAFDTTLGFAILTRGN